MFKGSCHCGAVRFYVDSVITELTTCDCSLCAMRNTMMAKIPEQALTVVQGETLLASGASARELAKIIASPVTASASR